MTLDFTLPLDSPRTTYDRAGGKGANLAELVRAGFEVPAAFIVTTDAYRAFVTGDDMHARIVGLARRCDRPEAAQRASQAIHALFAAQAIPAEISSAILAAHAALVSACGPAVAVRSSATAEDLPGLSFAGQQDTYLNVVGPPALLSAVRNCWASLWTARAIAYRARNGIDPEGIALAIVVQAMVEPDTSGVLFTADPLTGHRQHIAIDASFGLGEALVSGQVEPDHYVVARDAWRIVERRRGAKATVIEAQLGGGTRTVTRDGDDWALTAAQAVELAQLGARIAAHFGMPQDVEWAGAAGRFVVLQSRPITSLYPLPLPPGETKTLQDRQLFFSFNAAQGVTDPITPLGIDALQMFIGGLARELGIARSARDFMPAAGGRLYVNVTDLAADRRLRRGFLTALLAADPASRPTVARLVAEGEVAARRSLTLKGGLAALRGYWPMIKRVARVARRPERAATIQAESDAFLDRAGSNARAARDLASTLDAMRVDLDAAMVAAIAPVMATAMPGLLAMRLISAWLTAWLHESSAAVLALSRSLPGNVTTLMDLELWSVARAIQAHPDAHKIFAALSADELRDAFGRAELPAEIQLAVARFLDHYGVRGTAEIDIGRPRWRDDPSALFETLRSYLRIDDPAAAPDAIFARGAEDAERAARGFSDRIRALPLGALRARAFEAAYHRMRLLAGRRETPKLYLVRLLGLYRAALLERGAELRAQGQIEYAEDVFFVPFADLRAFAAGETVDLRRVASASREAYEAEARRRQLPRLLLSDGRAFYGEATALSDDATLVGQAVSPGVVEGAVRVVLDPREAHLEPGEILVCPATDPSWTPLFLSAAGLVMEMGGMMTHGSVVAREYGIPAVVGVPHATTRLHTGQRVSVDGGVGRITLLEA